MSLKPCPATMTSPVPTTVRTISQMDGLEEEMDDGMYSLYECLPCILTHLLNLLATPPWAHSPSVAIIVLLLLELDIGAVARYYDGAA